MYFNPLHYPPYNHFQRSSDGQCDAEACLSYGRVDCLIPLCKLYGDNTDYNPEYLAEASHTTPQGNTEFNIDLAWYQDGLVSTSVLPYLTQFTWGQLYNRDLTAIIPIGRKFWDKYDAAKSPVEAINPSQASLISQQATFADPYTVQVIVDLNDGVGSPLYHSQALLSGQIWDSYPTNPKVSNHPIIWAWKISLTPKKMSNVLLVKKGTEYGFYLPATTEQAMIDKANNFGYALPTLNNGSAVDWTNVRADLTVNP